MKKWFMRCLAAVLCLGLCAGLVPAQALTVEQAREILQEWYIDPVPQAALEQETVEATVDALGDPYSWYMGPEELEEYLNTDVDEKIVGIGITLTAHEDGIEVIRAEAGGPAAEAGLEAGDVIVAADGVELKGMDIDAVAELIRGEEGTAVRITYRRENRRRTVSIVRRQVVIAATRGELLDGGVGYIQCDSFGTDTAGHFRALIREMESEANVWVVDLRGDPGGVVDAVGEVGSLFAGPGAYITLRDKSGSYEYYGARREAITHKPVVVLVDGDSASAAEALTAALRDYVGALVIGARTFGKGIAQDIICDWQYPEYFTDGDGIKLTTNRFFSPLGNTNDSLGIIPDVNVDPRLALGVAALLAPTWSEEEAAEGLLFALEGTWYTVELDGVKADEGRRLALEALLNALPRHTTLVRQGQFTSFETLAEAFALEIDHWEFPDGETGTVCDGSVFDTLYTYDLLAGKGDGLVHPEDVLTRAEMCQLVAVALNCRLPDNDPPFDDVDPDAWYAPAVTALYNRGMVTGDEKGRFRPEEAVDHQQFLAVVGRLAAWLNCDLGDILEDAGPAELERRELEGYDPWARGPVWLLSCALEGGEGEIVNLLWDEPEAIEANAPTTRDEAASALYQVLRYLTIL